VLDEVKCAMAELIDINLATIVWVWGCVVLGMSQTKSATGLLIGRFFLGAIEAGLYPGALFILTCWYTKKEVGTYAIMCS
jgi:MFS family permease